MMTLNEIAVQAPNGPDHPKATIKPMTEERRLEIVAQFTDNVLTELAAAFIDVVRQEHWGKRDLAQISGLHETAIGYVLAGRRKNLTIETIALLARVMRKRPELVLHDLRPKRNDQPQPPDGDSFLAILGNRGRQEGGR